MQYVDEGLRMHAHHIHITEKIGMRGAMAEDIRSRAGAPLGWCGRCPGLRFGACGCGCV